MTSSVDLQNAIYEQGDRLRSGSLSFWGHWFGKPYDNVHRIVGANGLDDTIVIFFDQAETVTIEAPREWSLEGGVLVIRRAARVRFQWFCYGELPSRETLQFMEYLSSDGVIRFSTDFEPVRSPEIDPTMPAVELHPGGVGHSR